MDTIYLISDSFLTPRVQNGRPHFRNSKIRSIWCYLSFGRKCLGPPSFSPRKAVFYTWERGSWFFKIEAVRTKSEDGAVRTMSEDGAVRTMSEDGSPLKNCPRHGLRRIQDIRIKHTSPSFAMVIRYWRWLLGKVDISWWNCTQTGLI